jgi:hypothetical protein
MADESSLPVQTPHELLRTVRDLTHQVRIAQRSTWFPLLVFAATILVAIPVYRYAPHRLGRCRLAPQGTSVCTSVNLGLLFYWPVALLFAYTAIAGFYIQVSRRRGVGTRIRPYVVAGGVIALLLTAGTLWREHHLPSSTPLSGVRPPISVLELANATAAIGVALLVLAWFERNRALGAFSIVYLAIVLGSFRVDWTATHPSQWHFLPQLLLPAAMLLVGSIGFALIRPAGERQVR